MDGHTLNEIGKCYYEGEECIKHNTVKTIDTLNKHSQLHDSLIINVCQTRLAKGCVIACSLPFIKKG